MNCILFESRTGHGGNFLEVNLTSRHVKPGFRGFYEEKVKTKQECNDFYACRCVQFQNECLCSGV